ncbi:MAG TPA: hypothetical protein VJL57_01950 [Candidatus Paceibacterota bacterium]
MSTSRAIHFLPRYIGALKYYEKLFPALRERGFEPSFLFFEDKGMIDYCKERGLSFDARFVRRGGHIPFITPLLWESKLLGLFEPFLQESQPYALVTEPSSDQRARSLFKVAEKRGIKRHALQWALHTDPRKHIKRTLYSRYLVLWDRYGSLWRAPLVSAYYALLYALFVGADLLNGGDTYIHKNYYMDKLGTIDDTLRDYFHWRGWRDDQIRIVGSADYSLIRRAVEAAQTGNARKSLLEHYGLSEGRTRILILSHPFYTGRNSVYLKEEEQREYYKKIFEDVWSVYKKEETDIIFKLHPREKKETYTAFDEMGIRIFGNEADLNELISLSQLYIAHPLTAANFSIRASGKQAIFINFSPLMYLDEGKDLYRLSNIVKDHDEFRSMLQEASDGTLPLQYDTSGVDHRSLEKIIGFLID